MGHQARIRGHFAEIACDSDQKRAAVATSLDMRDLQFRSRRQGVDDFAGGLKVAALRVDVQMEFCAKGRALNLRDDGRSPETIITRFVGPADWTVQQDMRLRDRNLLRHGQFERPAMFVGEDGTARRIETAQLVFAGRDVEDHLWFSSHCQSPSNSWLRVRKSAR